METKTPTPVLEYDRPMPRSTSLGLRIAFGIAALLISVGAGLMVTGLLILATSHRFANDSALMTGTGVCLLLAGFFLMIGVLWTRFARLLS